MKERKPKVMNNFPDLPDMTVIMRKDLYDNFDTHLKKITKETGASYFGHNIIKNYRDKNHHVSTFCNHESWHELYWKKYYNEDLSEKIGHQATQKNNFGVVSWGIARNINPCVQERMKRNHVQDGIVFSFKKPENYLETFLIGWEHLNTKELDADYIFHLTSLLKPLRDQHWQVHDKI